MSVRVEVDDHEHAQEKYPCKCTEYEKLQWPDVFPVHSDTLMVVPLEDVVAVVVFDSVGFGVVLDAGFGAPLPDGAGLERPPVCVVRAVVDILVQRILREHHLQGSALLGFGDGFVEIENVVAVGGTAIGVASDEVNPGRVNPWKRRRLVDAGAHMIVADLTCADQLMSLLLA